MYKKFLIIATLVIVAFAVPARANFIISSAIVEFTGDGSQQHDVELVSRGQDNDYIVTEINEVVNPGAKNESRKLIEDPSSSRLMVTPDKSILAAGSRKLLRFLLLKPSDDHEHIYRVAVKPVLKGLNSKSQIGLKVLVAYEILVIVRPSEIKTSYQAVRTGKDFTVTNNGNSNVLFQNGNQCEKGEKDKCNLPPVVRVYPGQTEHVKLKLDEPVTYSVWDGKETTEKQY